VIADIADIDRVRSARSNERRLAAAIQDKSDTVPSQVPGIVRGYLCTHETKATPSPQETA